MASINTKPAPDRTEDEREIRALIREWSRALEAKDLDRLMAPYARDTLLFDAIPPHQTRGAAAYRAAWEQCLPCFPAKFKSEHHELELTVGDNVAFAHCLHRVNPIEEKTHPAGMTWLRVTVCYRKIDGHWRIVHEHISVPFDPMTGKAVYIPTSEGEHAAGQAEGGQS